MKITSKRVMAGLCAAAAPGMTACASPITVSFDSPLPWQTEDELLYEKLVYSVAIYDTTGGTGDGRVKLTEDHSSYTLEFTGDARIDGSIKYSTLTSDFVVTYNQSAPAADRGKTDTVKSSVEFQATSLAASTMTKDYVAAPREGVKNMSYSLTADYFGTGKATCIMTGDPAAEVMELSLSQGAFYDNESLIYVARATGLGAGWSPNFYLTNIFDSFVKGGLTTYTMAAECEKGLPEVDLGDWVKEYGVEQKTEEDGSTNYKFKCFAAHLKIAATKSGPPFVVYYSTVGFKKDGKEHKKLPVYIYHDEYEGSKHVRRTEYYLRSCSFEREA